MWNAGWEGIFQKSDWGQYPGEDVIRFFSRSFPNRLGRRNIKVLEIGCGTGSNIWFLAREGFDVFGLDGSQTAILKTREKLDREQLSAELKVGDVVDLCYNDNFFDVVLDVECMYANSLDDTKKIVSEVLRVLKPSGRFYSRTFMDWMSGVESGTVVESHRNTFLNMPEGPLRDDYGIIRLTSESEIPILYAGFNQIDVDFQKRSIGNQKHFLGEWMITCVK